MKFLTCSISSVRLQDLQVTIEVRLVSVSDRFFERIGIDFDFDVQDFDRWPDL